MQIGILTSNRKHLPVNIVLDGITFTGNGALMVNKEDPQNPVLKG